MGRSRIITNYIDSGALGKIDFDIVAHNSIDLSLSNINGLAYHKVYVLKDSYLYEMIKDLPGIDLETYATPTDLKRIASMKAIIVLDSNTSKYYLTKLTNDYTSRYSSTYTSENYTFRYKNANDTFYKLFNAYTKTIDINEQIIKLVIVISLFINILSNIIHIPLFFYNIYFLL